MVPDFLFISRQWLNTQLKTEIHFPRKSSGIFKNGGKNFFFSRGQTWSSSACSQAFTEFPFSRQPQVLAGHCSVIIPWKKREKKCVSEQKLWIRLRNNVPVRWWMARWGRSAGKGSVWVGRQLYASLQAAVPTMSTVCSLHCSALVLSDTLSWKRNPMRGLNAKPWRMELGGVR